MRLGSASSGLMGIAAWVAVSVVLLYSGMVGYWDLP